MSSINQSPPGQPSIPFALGDLFAVDDGGNPTVLLKTELFPAMGGSVATFSVCSGSGGGGGGGSGISLPSSGQIWPIAGR